MIMMKGSGVITAIKVQKDLPGRLGIFIDGEFAFDLSAEILLSSGLRVGQKLEEGQVEQLLKEERTRRAREYAIAALSRKARSKAEVRDILRRKGVSADISEEVLARLEEEGLLDDERFLRDWIDLRSRMKPVGRARLRQELLQRGIERTLIEDGLKDISREEEGEVALALARKRLGDETTLEDEGVRRRLFAFLQRRGFPLDVIREVFRKLEGDLDPDGGDGA